MPASDPTSTAPSMTSTAATSRSWLAGVLDRYALRIAWGPLLFAFILAIDLVPSASLVFGGSALGEAHRAIAFDFLRLVRDHVFVALLATVLFGPVIETLLVWSIIATVRSISGNADIGIVLGAVVLSWLHVPTGVLTAAGMGWPFLIWGTVLVSARLRTPASKFLFVCALHATHNAIVVGLLSLWLR